MVKPLMLAPLIVFGAFAALALVGLGRENPNELPTALAGRPAPAVQVTPLGEGPIFDDADLRGEGVKLVNYWASWCAPCRVEHPNLTGLAAEGVTIYGVNYKDKPGNALGFLAELGNPYAAMGADESGRMALDWGVYGVPETYVIDGRGNIVLRFAGPITERVLENTIRPAIEAAQ
ncbi:MAG: DsbE family thiol:disulfide interchange protein [Alphaproteobacteria bacterium HGW-Alphaproteobacteria-1]|jgi:cytochrome c biogenesis protein CcmG/thiol:disulfide interchange protein DsbE|nr:MAG: DsbE family thiol:disulfide interchange protein [Alphaproteobacteria bacterium HGW-Alphaproteobacteria-1]